MAERLITFSGYCMYWIVIAIMIASNLLFSNRNSGSLLRSLTKNEERDRFLESSLAFRPCPEYTRIHALHEGLVLFSIGSVV